MATGSFNLTKSSGDSYLIGMISWSSTPNVSGNYSDVKATIYVRKDNDDMKLTIPTSGKWSYSLTINGSTVSGTTSKNVLTDWVELTTHTVSKVSHSADGSKTITISGSVTGPSGTSMEGKVTSGSRSVAMDTIPRTSTVTATNANIGSTTTITINRAASSFTHTLTYAFAGLTGTIATKTTGTSIAWTVPTSFYAKIPNDPSGTCTITCTTYSGTTAIGTAACTFTATASVASCAPTVSVTAVDTNTDVIALTGSNKRIVKGFSDVKVTTTATAKNSATISSVDVYCGSAKQTGTSVTFAGAESAAILATATDSRGYPTTATATGLTLVNYIVPTIKETISRESPTSDTVNISVSGNWFNGSFGSKANTLKVQVRYKPKSQASYADTDGYVNMTVTTSGNTYTATLSLPGLEYTKAYSVQIMVSDAIHVYDGTLAEPIYKNTEISKGVPVFDWGEDDFNFNVPVNFNAGMTVAPVDGAAAIDGEGNGKTPLIYIVEQGVSGSWTYRKWSDGLAELWGICKTTHANGSVLGGRITYPFLLNGTVYAIGTINSAGGNGGAALPWNLKITYGLDLCEAWIHNAGSVGFTESSTIDVSVHVVGRWK